MNSQAKVLSPSGSAILSQRNIAWCGLFWLLLVLVELAPNIYVDWANGDAPAFNQMMRSASVYLYWFFMSLLIGYAVACYPLAKPRQWRYHILYAIVLSLGYVSWSALSVKIFAIASQAESTLTVLFTEHFLRFFLGELVIYAIIAGAWTLAWRQQQALRSSVIAGRDAAMELAIRDSGSLRRIPIDDIVRLESLENYVVVHTGNEKLMHRATLKSMLEKLGDKFIQVHRSSAVNRGHVRSLCYADNTLELSNGDTVSVGRRRLASVSNLLKAVELS